MTNKTPCLRFLTFVGLLAGTVLVAGCGSSDKVTKTTTTEQTSTTTPPPVTSTTTTTTTQQTRP
jgi:uncharacterized lipoprotein YajG